MESEDILDMFVRESQDILRDLEAGLLSLEKGGDREDTVARIFRAAHTLKGNAGMAGLHRYVQFAHAMENVIDRIRSHLLDVDGEIIEALLRGTDVLRQMTDTAAASGGEGEPDRAHAQILERLAAILGDSSPIETQALGLVREFDISLRFPAGSFVATPDPMELLGELADAGELLGLELDLSRLPPLAELDPTVCYLSWRMRLRGPIRRDDVLATCMFTLDDQDLTVVEKTGPVPAPAAAAPPMEAQPKSGRAERKAKARSVVRVDTDKLDRLVDLVGEFVIALSHVSEKRGDLRGAGDEARVNAVDTLMTIGRDMQDQVMSLRMVPIKETFERFRRPVRDLARELGKMVELEMSGTETELDKNVIDELVDPLKHMVRNSIAHGLETPAERRAAGKNEVGRLHLRAAQEEGRVLIEIRDDGRGIDTVVVLQKARERGLVSSDKALSERQIYDLLFLPGFSTAEKVSEIAGRGVGLDVVSKSVEAHRGAIEVSSQRGRGTTFHIRLPLTLAIVEGMNVRVGKETVSIPLLSVIELLEVTDSNIRTIEGKNEFIDIRGQLLPVVRLAALFDTPSDCGKSGGKIVVVECDRRKFGIVVDGVLGMSQAVIKPMEESFRLFRRMDAQFRPPRGVGGATILSDGTVGLVLDVQGLERMAFEA